MKPQYNKDATINIEYDHPVLGLIPFTASKDDVDETGIQLYNDIIAGKYGKITPYVESIIQARKSKISSFVTDYQIAITKDITYNSVIYQADKASQDDLNVVLTGLGTNDVPPGFYWVAKDNSHNPFTKIDLTNLSKLLVDRGWTAFNKLQVAKGKVNGATDIASVDNVVY